MTDQSSDGQTQLATLGGGCFWCLDAVFEKIEGVKNIISGYAGGHLPDPTYQQICNGDTGHAEVVQIEFDPEKISYPQLLDLFWHMHDPTTPNRQGADIGSQYRSIIFHHDDSQRAVAEQSKTEAADEFDRSIVTEVVPLTNFYPAETYHQHYFRNNPNAPYCAAVIRPKLTKLSLK